MPGQYSHQRANRSRKRRVRHRNGRVVESGGADKDSQLANVTSRCAGGWSHTAAVAHVHCRHGRRTARGASKGQPMAGCGRFSSACPCGGEGDLGRNRRRYLSVELTRVNRPPSIAATHIASAARHSRAKPQQGRLRRHRPTRPVTELRDVCNLGEVIRQECAPCLR